MGDSKKEILERLEIENPKLVQFQQKIRDFKNTVIYDNEINPNEFLDLAENNKTKYYRTPIFDLILDSQRVRYLFTLKVDIIINDGEPFKVNRF